MPDGGSLLCFTQVPGRARTQEAKGWGRRTAAQSRANLPQPGAGQAGHTCGDRWGLQDNPSPDTAGSVPEAPPSLSLAVGRRGCRGGHHDCQANPSSPGTLKQCRRRRQLLEPWGPGLAAPVPQFAPQVRGGVVWASAGQPYHTGTPLLSPAQHSPRLLGARVPAPPTSPLPTLAPHQQSGVITEPRHLSVTRTQGHKKPQDASQCRVLALSPPCPGVFRSLEERLVLEAELQFLTLQLPPCFAPPVTTGRLQSSPSLSLTTCQLGQDMASVGRARSAWINATFGGRVVRGAEGEGPGQRRGHGTRP